MSVTVPDETAVRLQRTGPLTGVRVLSLENYLAGNHTTFFLTLFGAEIIKVERPGVGDALRGPESQSGHLDNKQQNKRSVAIDLRSEAGLALFMDLVAEADVVFSNMKVSSLHGYGITFESLIARKPDIVYTTLTGFGHDDVLPAGPSAGWPAFDVIAQGMSGMQFRCLGPEDDMPGYNGLPIGDDGTAIFAAFGTVLALRARDETGKPQRVDVSMHDSMVYLNASSLNRWKTQQKEAGRGRSIGGSAPYGAYRTADGWVNLAVWGERLWRRFCIALDRLDIVDDPRFDCAANRLTNLDALNREVVTDFMAARTTAEVLETLHREGIPCAPIYTTEQAVESEQVAARRMFTKYHLRDGGMHETIGSPIKLSAVDEDIPLAAPPLLGGDTRNVLASLLHLSADEIEKLRAEGVIAQSDNAR